MKYMDKEILFAKTLESVKREAKEQGNCISKERIHTAFAEMNLAHEQMELVFNYLQNYKIGIDAPVNTDDYLTEEEINYLEIYMEELRLVEEVSEGEKEAITLSAMAGDVCAQKRLVEIYLSQVVEIAKLYTGQGVLLEDLIGEGNVAAAIGVSMLGCMENSQEAEGMLGKIIMDAMEDYINNSIKELKADKSALDRVNKVADRAREMAEDLHRKVKIDELAEETRLSENTIMEALRMSGDNIEYIEK